MMQLIMNMVKIDADSEFLVYLTFRHHFGGQRLYTNKKKLKNFDFFDI